MKSVLRMLRLGELDGVGFIALDRWGRTMSELVLEMEEFSKTGKVLFSLKEGLDLNSAAGRLFGHVLAAMANFERDRIRERTMLGLARAKAQGKRLGRPRKTPPENPKVFQSGNVDPKKSDVYLKFKQKQLDGWDNHKIANHYGLSLDEVVEVLKDD
jgi:DNA invertase Pin-like site-specific DNA recombinase